MIAGGGEAGGNEKNDMQEGETGRRTQKYSLPLEEQVNL